jgi:hypothetical protein
MGWSRQVSVGVMSIGARGVALRLVVNISVLYQGKHRRHCVNHHTTVAVDDRDTARARIVLPPDRAGGR